MRSCGDQNILKICNQLPMAVVLLNVWIKHLGEIIHRKLNWALHVQYVKNKLRKMILCQVLSVCLSSVHCRTAHFAYFMYSLFYSTVSQRGRCNFYGRKNICYTFFKIIKGLIIVFVNKVFLTWDWIQGF